MPDVFTIAHISTYRGLKNPIFVLGHFAGRPLVHALAPPNRINPMHPDPETNVIAFRAPADYAQDVSSASLRSPQSAR